MRVKGEDRPLKLFKFKDGSRNRLLNRVKQKQFHQNYLHFILFKDYFLNILFEMFIIFIKLYHLSTNNDFVITNFKCTS